LERIIQDLVAIEFLQLEEIHGVVLGLEAIECPILNSAESIGGVALGESSGDQVAEEKPLEVRCHGTIGGGFCLIHRCIAVGATSSRRRARARVIWRSRREGWWGRGRKSIREESFRWGLGSR
jgi:hypothetical protein